MSKNVNKTIQTTINEIKKATVSAFGARYYEADQVIAILNNLMKDIGEDDDEDTSGKVLTKAMLQSLTDEVEELISNNIENLNESDIVEENSIEMTLCNGRYTVDNIDLDKDAIANEAIYSLSVVINDWAEHNELITSI